MKLRPRFFVQFGHGVAQVLDVESGIAKVVAVFLADMDSKLTEDHQRQAQMFAHHLNAEQETREAVDEVAPKNPKP